MRKHTRRPLAQIMGAALAGLLAAVLVAAAALPVLAKEGLEARLDAPLGRDTPAGTAMIVGMMVTAPDGAVSRPVEGSPIYLKLIGGDGSSTRAAGDVDTIRGHYTMRILVPEGGIEGIEVGMHGTTDLPITVVGSPLVVGGVTGATTQVAPALAPAVTQPPRESAAAVAAVAAPVVTPAAPGAVDVPRALPFPGLALIGGLAVAGGLLVLLLVRRRTRTSPRPAAPGQEPGA